MSANPLSTEVVELRRTILEALDPILDEEEANDAAIAAADAVLNPPGLDVGPTTQGDIVDHELLAAHDQIAQLRQELDKMRAARDAVARDFLAASQAEERVRRERDDARSAGRVPKDVPRPEAPGGAGERGIMTATTGIDQADVTTVQRDLDDTIAGIAEVQRLMRGGAALAQVADAIYEAKTALERAEAYVDSLEKAAP